MWQYFVIYHTEKTKFIAFRVYTLINKLLCKPYWRQCPRNKLCLIYLIFPRNIIQPTPDGFCLETLKPFLFYLILTYFCKWHIVAKRIIPLCVLFMMSIPNWIVNPILRAHPFESQSPIFSHLFWVSRRFSQSKYPVRPKKKHRN